MQDKSEAVSAEDFVAAWQRGRTRQEVADSLGISSAAAGTRASKLRGQGVPLKRFARGSSVGTHDVDALKKLAKDLNPRSDEK